MDTTDARPSMAVGWSAKALTLILTGLFLFQISQYALDMSSNVSAASVLPDFQRVRLYYESSPLARGAIGDAIPSRPGNELITCSFGGIVTATYGSDDSWTSETVYKAYYGDSQEIVQVNSVAVADVMKERPGDEVLTVGNDMNLRLSVHNGSNWQTSVIYSDVDWLYEVCADDIDGDGQLEIAIVGETKTLTVLHREGKRWNGTIVARDTYLLEACTISELDPEHAGKEIVSGGKSGRLILVYNDGEVYRQRTIAELSTDITDIAVSDLDPSIPGKEIYVSLRNGKVYCVWMEAGSQWSKRAIHDEGDIIYGMEAGELSQGTPILLTASYKHRLGLISHTGLDHDFRTIYSEEWNVLGSVIGDLDPTHSGNEMFSLSQLGRLTMLYHDPPGLDMTLPFAETRVGPGEDISIPFAVRAKGGLSGSCTISVGGITGASVSSTTVELPGAAFVKLKAPNTPGLYTINITASQGSRSASSEISLMVSSGSPHVSFIETIVKGSVAKDRENRFTLSVISAMGLASPLKLTMSPYPIGLSGVLNRTSCLPCDIPDSISLRVSADPSSIPGRYVVFLMGTSDPIRRAAAIVLEVTEEAISDFRLDISGSAEGIQKDGERLVELRIISENGFDSIVNITIGPLPDNMRIGLSKERIRPTGNLTMIVSGNATDGPYIIPIIARSGATEKIVYIKVSFKERMVPPSIEAASERVTPESLTDGIATWRFQMRLVPGSEPLKRTSLVISQLPIGFNVSLQPSQVDSLPYPINITVNVWGPSRDAPLTVNFTLIDPVSGEGFSRSILLEIAPATHNKNGTTFPWVILILVSAFIAALGGITYLYTRTRPRPSNPLKTDGTLTRGHDPPHNDHNGIAPRELHNGGRSGMDRRIGKLR
jgi:hypothetical protein